MSCHVLHAMERLLHMEVLRMVSAEIRREAIKVAPAPALE